MTLHPHDESDARYHDAMAERERDGPDAYTDDDCQCSTLAEIRACPRCSPEELTS